MNESKDISAEQLKTFALDVIKEIRSLLKPDPIERELLAPSELPEKQETKVRAQPSVEKQLYFMDQDIQHMNEILGLVIFALLLLAIGCYICFQQLNQRTRRLAHVVYHHYVAQPGKPVVREAVVQTADAQKPLEVA